MVRLALLSLLFLIAAGCSSPRPPVRTESFEDMAAKLTAGKTPVDVERELGPPDYVTPPQNNAGGELGFVWRYEEYYDVRGMDLESILLSDSLTIIFAEGKIRRWTLFKDGNWAGSEVFRNESANSQRK